MDSPHQDEPGQTRRKAVIGNINSSFWLYDSINGFDLTHPKHPDAHPNDNAVKYITKGVHLKIDPAKSALLIVDMQNFFLSPALGRSTESNGLRAQQQLLKYAIPAARKAGIRIVWLNWGLTDEELRVMPPAILRCFGFETLKINDYSRYLADVAKKDATTSSMQDLTPSKMGFDAQVYGKKPKLYVGLGNDLGSVTLGDGLTADAGRMLMRDQWNSALTPELHDAYRNGLEASPPDVWIHKNRMSGLWGSSSACTEFLDKEGIKTLFFAGVNTDQCVGGSLTDAFTKGYDCILLSDGAATSSPNACQEAYEFNAAGTYGFCMSCKNFWDGVEASIW